MRLFCFAQRRKSDHAGELLLTHLTAQINIKTHTDIADQQTSARRHLNMRVAHLNQPVFCQRLQQRQIVGKIVGKLKAVALFDISEIQFKMADQRLDHVAAQAVIIGHFQTAP